MSERVLFVDDEPNVLAAYRRQFRRDFDVHTATSGADGLDKIATAQGFAVVVSDMRMPGMDGIAFLRAVKERAPETVRIILTGNADQQTAIDACNEVEIFRFFTKPCAAESLETGIRQGIRQHQLVTSERELLERTLAGSVKVLTDVLALVVPGAFRKSARLRSWAAEAARSLALSNAWELDMAAMLSPLGEITLPAETAAKLHAGRPLQAVEEEMVAHMPDASRSLLANIPRMRRVGDIIYYHRKGFDGSGVPQDGAAGEALPLEARILRILTDLADATDRERPDDASFDRLEKNSRAYDPALLGRLRASLAESVSPEERDERAVPVSFDALLPGHLLVSDIRTMDGRLLLGKGQSITRALLEKLRNLNRIRPVDEPILVLRKTALAAAGATPTEEPAKAGPQPSAFFNASVTRLT